MFYYYANSGHKIGLDRVKRGVALLKAMQTKGVEVRLLVNDFRAGLVAKTLGLRDYVTIETVMDIDAIANAGDSVMIDSPEDDKERLIKYCSDFGHVFRFEISSNDTVRYSETLMRAKCEEEACIESIFVDKVYQNDTAKENRTLFFLGDADYDKEILENRAFFESSKMELLLGNYFFVKYEEELAKLFVRLHEPEEYIDLLKSSRRVVTTSALTAIEAHACGADTLYIATSREQIVPLEVIETLEIPVIEGFDREAFLACVAYPNSTQVLPRSVEEIAMQVIERLKA